ncbi:MAG: phosphoribosylglycinamide formyltransferase [Clostridia bacterium]|nr:phosphoribosylglycinamide formyltransferase [Clostridia bacterium]
MIDAIENKTLDAKISLVVSDHKEAYALQRAKISGIATYVIKSKTTKEMDEELVKELQKYPIDLIVLAGYLRMIGNNLLKQYTIINTHPSLLPKFGGKGMYGMNVHKAVIEAKEEYSGVTLHYVNDQYDKGNIIKQTKVKVEPTDTPESLASKVQKAEKIQLVEVLQKFVLNKKD